MLAPCLPNFWISGLLPKKDVASSTLKSTYGPRNTAQQSTESVRKTQENQPNNFSSKNWVSQNKGAAVAKNLLSFFSPYSQSHDPLSLTYLLFFAPSFARNQTELRTPTDTHLSKSPKKVGFESRACLQARRQSAAQECACPIFRLGFLSEK